MNILEEKKTKIQKIISLIGHVKLKFIHNWLNHNHSNCPFNAFLHPINLLNFTT